MALPKLLQMLFANAGVGPKLREDILPDNVLLNEPGSLSFLNLSSSMLATLSDAESGTDNTKLMTALRVKEAIDALAFPFPTGGILIWPGEEPPDGFIVADGREISRTTYAKLFAVYGTKYGAGDGTTTFNVMDMDQLFAEFTTDPSQVGKYMPAGLPNITGQIGETLTYSGSPSYGAFDFELGDSTYSWATGQGQVAYPELDASRSSSIYGGSDSVQPSSLQLLPCIKS